MLLRHQLRRFWVKSAAAPGRERCCPDGFSFCYRVCNTIAPNGCRFFSQLDIPDGVALMQIALNTAASGGSDKESISSIRFNAPRTYDRQNRNVTENEFEQTLTSLYSSVIQSVSVWGGEKNTTPVYGKVYISVKPVNGFTLTDSQKAAMAAALQPYNIMAIETVFVDATFSYIVPQVNVWFNSQLTSLTAPQLLSEISTTIQNFETNTLGAFKAPFYFSRFTSAIDATDASILGNDTHILLQKRFTPQLNSSFTYSLNFHQQLVNPYPGFLGCVSSNGFRVPLYSQTVSMGAFTQDEVIQGQTSGGTG